MKLQIKSFFGEVGFTTTSANHIANLAKEYYQKLEIEIESISAFDKYAKLISSNEEMIVSKGTDKSEFLEISKKLEKIAECKGFIAYLREAIKERELLYKSIIQYTDTEARSKVQVPFSGSALTKDDVLGSWSTGELIRYYSLEAKCATLGEMIHKNGCLNNLRKEYYKKVKQPIELVGEGRDMIKYSNTPTITSDDLESIFFKLQSDYRDAQAELNGLKHQIDVTIENDNIKYTNENAEAWQKYNEEMRKITDSEIRERNEALENFEKLRIVVPERFKNIYQEITKLSK